MREAQNRTSTNKVELQKQNEKGDHSPSNHLFKYHDISEITSQNVLSIQLLHGLLLQCPHSIDVKLPTLQDD